MRIYGLRWETRRRRVDGKLERYGLIDQVHLEKMKALTTRRSQAVPPSEIYKKTPNGGTPQTLVTAADLADLQESWKVAENFTARDAVFNRLVAK